MSITLVLISVTIFQQLFIYDVTKIDISPAILQTNKKIAIFLIDFAFGSKEHRLLKYEFDV